MFFVLLSQLTDLSEIAFARLRSFGVLPRCAGAPHPLLATYMKKKQFGAVAQPSASGAKTDEPCVPNRTKESSGHCLAGLKKWRVTVEVALAGFVRVRGDFRKVRQSN